MKFNEKQKVYSLKEASEILGTTTEALVQKVIDRKLSAGLSNGEMCFSGEELKRYIKGNPGTRAKMERIVPSSPGEEQRLIEIRQQQANN